MRVDFETVFPGAMHAMMGLEEALERSDLDKRFLTMVKLRASQLNGCAYCTDMHSKDALALGEDEQRLHLLSVWRDSPGYSDRERAALAWCEALTLLPQRRAPQDVYDELARHFSPEQIVAVTLAVVAINGLEPFLHGLADASRRLCLTVHGRVGDESRAVSGRSCANFAILVPRNTRRTGSAGREAFLRRR